MAFIIKGRYRTNHPKDVAARTRIQAIDFARDNYCTNRELREPTEKNVTKCMAEIKSTRRIAEPFKRASKILGEDTDISKYRRER